jgi:nitroreductase
MRRVSSQPVPTEVVQQMLDAAIRAPSGSNMQAWRWLAITDSDVIAQVAVLYAESFDEAHRTFYAGTAEKAKQSGDTQMQRIQSSSRWLRDNMASVPLLIVACDRNDPLGSSIYPAVWNLMLAARGAGVGTTLTTFNYHLRHDETRELLGIPADKGWRIAALISCGYPTGRWGVAKRPPVTDVVFQDRWGNPTGWDVPGPLWSGDSG